MQISNVMWPKNFLMKSLISIIEKLSNNPYAAKVMRFPISRISKALCRVIWLDGCNFQFLLRPVPRPTFYKICLYSPLIFARDALELVFCRLRAFLKFSFFFQIFPVSSSSFRGHNSISRSKLKKIITYFGMIDQHKRRMDSVIKVGRIPRILMCFQKSKNLTFSTFMA